jgi:L-lysine exporter family protein LysE/ArgO
MLSAALAGFLTSMTLIVAIGAQNAFVLRQGIRREHVLPVVAVCATADALLITAGIAGLGALITNHPTVLSVTRYGGAAFLLVLAFGAFRRARRPEVLDPAAAGPASLSAVLTTCLALTFLNPHVYLDTVVLLGSLAHQHDPGAWAFGVGAVLASVTWFTALGFGAAFLRPVFARPRSWQVLDVIIGVVMATLAVLLVV